MRKVFRSRPTTKNQAQLKWCNILGNTALGNTALGTWEYGTWHLGIPQLALGNTALVTWEYATWHLGMLHICKKLSLLDETFLYSHRLRLLKCHRVFLISNGKKIL